MKQDYYACGKLLLSGEYLVLRSAGALAVPTGYGQRLSFEPGGQNLLWRSIDSHGNCWLQMELTPELQMISSSQPGQELFLLKLLQKGRELRQEPLAGGQLTATLEFDRNWGLGSSSSLTSLVAQWLEVDAMTLFFATQNGSGYDVAVAGACTPILYSLHHGRAQWQTSSIADVLKDSHFIYLNQKKHSDVAVKNFSAKKVAPASIEEISAISRKLTGSLSRGEAQKLLLQHEETLGKILGVPPVKQKLFSDYNGAVKSLGAWGGDYVWAIGENTEEYFKNKGFHTLFSYRDLILNVNK